MKKTTVGAELLKELEMEAGASRKSLERIPERLYKWKPHKKSMALGYLALIVAEIPKWISTMVHEPEIDFATFKHFSPKKTADLVKHFDENMAGAKKALAGVSDKKLNEPFSLKNNGKLIFTTTKKESIAPSINHLVHHRGQLTVYMRLNNLPVPSLYGPSADDQGF